MPAVQTSYPERMPARIEGMVVNSEPCVVISRAVQGAAGIGFGKVAVQGTADMQVQAATAGAAFRGVTVLDPSQPVAAGDKYPEKSIAAVMTKGVIAVLASVAVTAGQPAFFVPATGVFTNVATGNTAIPNAVFDTSGGAGALVDLRLA